MSINRIPRLPALVLATALLTTACQAPASTATPSTAGQPAKGQGTIKGVVTASGIQANAYAVLQAASAGARGSVSVSGPAFTGEVPCAADGSFSVNVPGGSDYVLTATTSDGKGGVLRTTAKVTVPLAEEPPIVDVASLVTRRTGSIQGLVTLADGSSAEGADVFVPGTTIVGKASAKGRFALSNVPEGVWNISLAKPGYKTVAVESLSVKAGTPLVMSDAISLEKDTATAGDGVKGLVRTNTGSAVVGATVTVYAKDNSGASLTAITDDQGAFQTSALAPGDYTVQVYRPFYNVPPRQEVTIKAGQGADLGTVTVTSTTVYFGKITGEVVDEAGEPVDGAVVQLAPQVSDQQFTDARGRFTLDRVMPGDYALSVSAGGYSVLTRDLRVDNIANFTAELDGTLVLRASVDPAKVKTAVKPTKAAPILLAPEAINDGADKTKLIWAPVGLPDTVATVVYDLEIENQAAPGTFKKYLTTENAAADLPADAKSMRIRSRDKNAPYVDEADQAAGYEVLGFFSFLKKVSTWVKKEVLKPVLTELKGAVKPVVKDIKQTVNNAVNNAVNNIPRP